MESCVRLLPDYAKLPNSGMALEKVGIKNFRQYRRDFSDRRTLTFQSAYVDLADQNGIHMSRLAAVLREHAYETIDTDAQLIQDLLNSHEEASCAYWECTWTSEHQLENEQEIYVDCQLEGVVKENVKDWYVTFIVPYASVCPCAARMCKENEYGVPHMQRASTRITCAIPVDVDLSELQTTIVSKVVDIVDLVPVPVMKRPDELDWCERAEDTNLFVEDASRIIGAAINTIVDDWVVVCTHYESIHQHDVVSVCRKGHKLV